MVVKAGQPVRLRFTRHESASSSGMVLFPDFSRGARLPEDEEVAMEFRPDEVGEYGFQRQMETFRSKLIVE